MQVMVIMKANEDSESGRMPAQEEFEAMHRYHEDLVKAGVLLAAEGLLPSSRGVRVEFSGSQHRVIDGPFTETKELVAGFWMWQVKSLQEAVEWAKRFPNPRGNFGPLEIRPVAQFEDLGDANTPELQERVKRIEEQAAQIVRR